VGAVEAVAEIAEAGDDVFPGVEAGVEDSKNDRNPRVVALDAFDPFRCADDADERDVRGAPLLDGGDGVGGGAASGEHGIDNQCAGLLNGREFEVVVAGDGGFVIALEADVADRDVRKNILERLEHSEPGAEDRNDDQRSGQNAAGTGGEGSFDVFLNRLQIACGLEGEEERELVAEVAEQDGLGGLVAEVGD